jgi:hypothetical protein
LLKIDLFTLKQFTTISYNVFFINLPVTKLKHDTAYLATVYTKRVHNYLGTREGSTLKVHESHTNLISSRIGPIFTELQ